MLTTPRASRNEYAPPAAPDAHDAPAWTTSCLNCAKPMHGPFCAHCGQRAVPPHPSIREFVGEAFAELTGWDGKFVETFKLLLAKPGAVTRQFIEGRRVRFISPVRLYLWMSLIYFILAAAAPDLAPPGLQSTFSVGAGTGADAAVPASRDSIVAAVARAPRWFKPIVRR